MQNRISLLFILTLAAVLSHTGCAGDGIGGRSGSSGTTVISGKVTLSGTVLGSSKASPPALYSVPLGKPGTRIYRESAGSMETDSLNKLVMSAEMSALGDATVDLYSADHPEWLYPVATGSTDGNGEYSLTNMTNASKNEGAAYEDGQPIPAGKYTLIAYKNNVIGQKPVVAVQTIVTEFAGDIPNVNFEVLDSDASPAVISILGLSKNKDGSQTWGTSTTTHPANAAIQVSFSMPMVRDSLENILLASTDGGIVPSGRWSLSADWMIATYYFSQDETLTVGKKYTVTVYGANDAGNNAKVVNVYGNTIDATSTAQFQASALDDISPSVQWNSPTVVEMGELVDVTQSFRVEANEILDVNNLSLAGSPSIGVKPGVLFLGKNSRGLYVYEFDLGAPLKLNTSYALTVSGGKDLAGHAMNILTGNVKTRTAENTPGIDPTVNEETQNLQAAVKAIFGKWTRSLNDRNLPQFQSMMSPEFYMEYDVSRGVDSSDINRDGRYSFAEFSRMVAGNAFLQWDYCGTTITGTISPTPDTYINVFPGELPPRSDFEFKLSASNTLNSRECSEAAPKENMYATLRYKNGVWKIVRASTGIDTRDKTISSPELLGTSLYQITNATSTMFSSSSDALSDGYKMDGVPNTFDVVNDPPNIAVRYKWDAMPGITTYVLLIMDARNPSTGMAVAFPANVTAVRTDEQWVAALGGTDVSQKFGFGDDNSMPGAGASFTYVSGGRYHWEVIGFGTISSADMPGKSRKTLLQDIKAASFLKSFSIAGSYAELLIQVKPGTNPNAAPVTYSEVLRGYDLKNNGWVTLNIYSPNKVPGGSLSISGSQYASMPLTFTAGLTEATLALYQGWNWVSICDEGDYTAVPRKPGLCKSFSILTTGGVPPTIQIWEVIDDAGNTLVGDSGQYFIAGATAKKVTIKGIVTDPSVPTLDLNLWNENGAYGSAAAQVNCALSACDFTFSNLEIYKGDNWINISGSGSNYYQSRIGIYGETGTAWVPPVTVTAVGESSLRSQYPSSSDWDANPGADYTVTVSGKFKIPANGTYNTWAEGGYKNGTLNVLSDGTFNLNVLLYNGWNYVSLYDSTGSWYGVNIYTTQGMPVIKPTVVSVDGAAYSGSGSVTTSGCIAKIDGTAVVGSMNINISGYGLRGDGAYDSFYENQTIQSTGTADPGDFTVYVPVASGLNSYTYIDIYDKDYKGASIQLVTNANCPYVGPSTTISGVKDDGQSVVSSDNSFTGPNEYGYYGSGASKAVTVYGTSNRPGLSVSAESETCGTRVRKSANASLTAVGGSYPWSITLPVYGTYNSGYNYIYLNDGAVYRTVYVISTNSEPLPSPPLQATASPGTVTYNQCNQIQYDSGAAQAVDISGTTTAPDGTGYYSDALNGNHPFTITNGSFTISNVSVYDGYNYLNITDTNSNYFYVTVTTTNQVSKPQFVEITAPLNNDTVSGSMTVTGTISDPVGSGYAPKTVYANVYESVTDTSTYYSSDLYEQQAYGYGRITFSGTDFSFVHALGPDTTSYSSIDVYAYDNVNGISHGHTVYVNTGGGWSGYYYKPGSRRTDPGKQRIEERRTMEWEIRTMLRSW